MTGFGAMLTAADLNEGGDAFWKFSSLGLRLSCRVAEELRTAASGGLALRAILAQLGMRISEVLPRTGR